MHVISLVLVPVDFKDIEAWLLWNTYHFQNHQNNNQDEDERNEQTDPLLFSCTASAPNSSVNLLDSLLEIVVNLGGALFNFIKDFGLFCYKSLHIREQLMQFLFYFKMNMHTDSVIMSTL